LKSKFDFFFSYSRAFYEEFSKHLIDDLSKYGIELWVDIHDVPFGVNVFQHLELILDKTESTLGAILILSEDFFRKEWCRIELEYFIENNIHVFPILFQLTKNDIPMEYSYIKSLDRVSVSSTKDYNYQFAINKILAIYINSNKENINTIKIESAIFESLVHSFIETQYKKSCIISANNIARYINYFYMMNKIPMPAFIQVIINITEIKLQHYFNEEFTQTDNNITKLAGKVLIDCHTKNSVYDL